MNFANLATPGTAMLQEVGSAAPSTALLLIGVAPPNDWIYFACILPTMAVLILIVYCLWGKKQ